MVYRKCSFRLLPNAYYEQQLSDTDWCSCNVKGQCGAIAQASSACNHHGPTALQSNWCLSSQPPKPQLKQELLYLSTGLNASVDGMSVDVVSNVSLDEGKVQASAQVPVSAGDSSLYVTHLCLSR